MMVINYQLKVVIQNDTIILKNATYRVTAALTFGNIVPTDGEEKNIYHWQQVLL